MCKNQYLEQLGSGSNYPESHCRERRQLGSRKEHLSCSAAEAQHSANPCSGKEALAASCCNSSSGGCSWLDEPGLITVCLIPSHHLHSSASTSPSIPASCPWLKGRALGREDAGCPAGRGTHLAARSLCSLSAATPACCKPAVHCPAAGLSLLHTHLGEDSNKHTLS